MPEHIITRVYLGHGHHVMFEPEVRMGRTAKLLGLPDRATGISGRVEVRHPVGWVEVFRITVVIVLWWIYSLEKRAQSKVRCGFSHRGEDQKGTFSRTRL
jgi:hypothetical protein